MRKHGGFHFQRAVSNRTSHQITLLIMSCLWRLKSKRTALRHVPGASQEIISSDLPRPFQLLIKTYNL